MKAGAVPTVFIVGDDSGMRQAVQDLVESVGLRAESEPVSVRWSKADNTN